MKVTRIVVLIASGTDKLLMTTDLPNPIWPFEGNLGITAETAAGSGEAYARQHFPEAEISVVVTAKI